MRKRMLIGIGLIAGAGPLVAVDLYREDFDLDAGGFSASGAMSTWQHGTPTSAPAAAHSGHGVWATSLSGPYAAGEDSYLVSPEIDLGSHAQGELLLSWWQYLEREEPFDQVSLEVTNDGGSVWREVCRSASGDPEGQWVKRFVVLDPSMAVDGFRFRFRLSADGSQEESGLAIDTVRIFSRDADDLWAEDFEGDDGGFVVGGVAPSWEWGTSSGETGGMWATDLDGFYQASEDSVLVSPGIDLSGAAGGSVLLSWDECLTTEAGNDLARVDARKADGTWVTVRGPTGGRVTTDWSRKSVVLGPDFAGPDFQIRFGLVADGFFENTGYVVDNLRVQTFSGGSQPVLEWAEPAPIESGTPLGPAQLNAMADVAGSLSYDPGSGTLLAPGLDQQLTVTFTPEDLLQYDAVVATVSLDVLVAPTGYEEWVSFPAGGSGGGALRGDDYDGDGWTNFAEYAFVTNAASGSDPHGLSSRLLLDEGGMTYQALVFRTRSNDPALTYRFRTSDDLSAWNGALLSFNAGSWSLPPEVGVIVSAVDLGSGVWRLSIRGVDPVAARTAEFMQVEVTES